MAEQSNAPQLMLADRLTTDRLVLRPPTREDAPAMIPLANDKGLAERLATMPHPYGPAEADYFFDEIAPKSAVWAITRRDDNAFIGLIGLRPDENANCAELGYWLGRPFWGAGYATEAAHAIVAYGFQAGGFDAITACYFDGNETSARVLTKLGFVETGQARLMNLALGRDEPETTMRLDRDRWRALNMD